MSEMDDLLQKKLEALENGQPLNAVLEELPGEASRLSELIRLVSAVRGLPHPHPSMQRDLAHRRRQPARSPRTDWLQLRPSVLLSGGLLTAMVLVFLFASLVGAGLWLAGPRNAQAATLMSVDGIVEVASSASKADWRLARDGFRVVEGQRIRTGAGASATLVFYEGTRAVLGSYTDVTLRVVKGGWGRTLQVVLDQRMGETVHSVVPLRGEKSLYHVNTPTSTASVHGTTFSVDVDLLGQSRFAVNKGKVRVSTQDSEVWLMSGQITAVEPGLALLEPSYQFELKGQLQEQEASTWMVNGVNFDLADGVVIEGDPQVNDIVEVEGHVLSNGAFEAYHIEKTSGEAKSSFSGVLESMAPDPWVVSGRTLEVVEGVTILDGDLALDQPVEVTFEVLGTSWVALKIESLAEEPEPEPTGPALSLEKSANPTQYDAVGDVISYSFVISNTSDAAIAGPFVVSDDKAANEACPTQPTSLAPHTSLTCTASYTIVQADLLAGSVTNTASASAANNNSPVTSNTDTATVQYVGGATALDLEKSAVPGEYDAVGDVIAYSYTVTNTGATDIVGPFSVTDNKIAAVDCSLAPASLAPGAHFTCTASYTISAADLAAGSVTNVAVAYASGANATSNTDSVTVYSLLGTAQLALEKSASPATFDAVGDVISYTYKLSNVGTLPIAGPFSVTDDKIAAVDCTLAPASLAPGASFNCTGHYTITGDDLNSGAVTNVATATAANIGAPVTSNSATATVTSSLVTDCTGNSDDHPKARKLAELHGAPYAEIMGWFCQHFGFGEIELAYSLAEEYAAFGITPAQLFEMRRSGWGWGEIKNWLKTLELPATEAPTDPSTTPEPKGNGQGPKNEPPGKSKPPKNNPPGKPTTPTNPSQNPTGLQLANRYGVSYDAIMGWYNQGYSFSDINQAYSLSQSYATPVSEIFTMRAAGKNWGQIRQELSNRGNRRP